MLQKFLLILLLISSTLQASDPGACLKGLKRIKYYKEHEPDRPINDREIQLIGPGFGWWNKFPCKQCGIEYAADPNVHGRQQCPSCGRAHEGAADDDIYEGATYRIMITDEKDLARLRSGDLKTCPYCGSSNFSIDNVCGGCGVHFHKPKNSSGPMAEVARDGDNSGDLPAQLTRGRRDDADTDSHSDRGNRTPAKKLDLVKIGMWALGGTAVVGTTLYVLEPKDDEFSAKAEEAKWEKTIGKETFTKVTKKHVLKSTILEDDPRMPTNGLGGKGGAFNVTNCVTEAGKVYCDYETYEWQPVGKPIPKSGDRFANNKETIEYPKMEIGERDRITKLDVYTVTLKFKEKGQWIDLPIQLPDINTFLSWQKNEKVYLQKDANGKIVRIRRKNGQTIYINKGAQ